MMFWSKKKKIEQSNTKIQEDQSNKETFCKEINSLLDVYSNFLSPKKMEEKYFLNLKSDKMSGLKTGFKKLDEITGGLKKSNLISVIARPGVGKTTFVMNLILNILKQGKKVIFFEMEEEIEEVYSKCISILMEKNLKEIENENNKKIKENEYFKKASEEFKKLNFLCKSSFSLKISEIESEIETIKKEETNKKEKETDIVFIDCLGTIKDENSGNNNEEKRKNYLIDKITLKLHELARKLKIAIVLVSHLNRSFEYYKGNRYDEKPILSDIKDSGSIEEDSEVIIFLYNDDNSAMYSDSKKTKLNIYVAKNRYGKTGDFTCTFYKDSGKITDQQDC